MIPDRLLQLTLPAAASVGAMGLMIFLTACSHTVRRPQKRYFLIIHCTVIAVVLTQYLSRLLEQAPPSLLPFALLIQVFSCLLIPVVPVVFSSVIQGYGRARILLPGYGLYAVIVVLSLKYPILFSVDGQGSPVRAWGYGIYILACLISTVYLIRQVWQTCTAHQHLSRITVVLLLGFLLIGTAVELFVPGVYTGCVSLSFSSVFCYLYFTEQQLQQDGLTGLLNHSTYLRRMEDISLGATLILFDVNKFKDVNDTCGHLF